MMYTILAIFGVIASLATYIYGLITTNRQLKDENAKEVFAKAEQEWNDKIAAQAGKVTEDVKDYQNAKDQFNANNPPTKPSA